MSCRGFVGNHGGGLSGATCPGVCRNTKPWNHVQNQQVLQDMSQEFSRKKSVFKEFLGPLQSIHLHHCTPWLGQVNQLGEGSLATGPVAMQFLVVYWIKNTIFHQMSGCWKRLGSLIWVDTSLATAFFLHYLGSNVEHLLSQVKHTLSPPKKVVECCQMFLRLIIFI